MPNFSLNESEPVDNRDARNDTHERISAIRTFRYSFTVRASLQKVAGFHQDTNALRCLTPPPLWIQFHSIEPLTEGSVSDFTLWFAFIPLRWVARHDNVDALHGFRDTQIEGPLARWEHLHTFTEEEGGVSRISEYIVYEHAAGLRGLFTRLLFNPLGLSANFFYRSFMTRRLLEK